MEEREDLLAHKLNREAFENVFNKLLVWFENEEPPAVNITEDLLITNGLFCSFAEAILQIAHLVFGTFALKNFEIPTFSDGTVVSNGRLYFLYLSEDPAHNYIRSGRTLMEAWLVLSAACRGQIGSPVLRHTNPSYDFLAYLPVHTEIGAWCQALPTYSQLTSDALAKYSTQSSVNIDVKMPSIGNSIDQVVTAVMKSHDPREFIMITARFKQFIQHKDLSSSMAQRLIYTDPIYEAILLKFARRGFCSSQSTCSSGLCSPNGSLCSPGGTVRSPLVRVPTLKEIVTDVIESRIHGEIGGNYPVGVSSGDGQASSELDGLSIKSHYGKHTHILGRSNVSSHKRKNSEQIKGPTNNNNNTSKREEEDTHIGLSLSEPPSPAHNTAFRS
jgi:hypothetical protein